MDKLQVQMDNMRKDAAAQEAAKAQEAQQLALKEKAKLDDAKLKLARMNQEKQDLMTSRDSAEAKREELDTERERLLVSYGKLKGKMESLTQHPVLRNTKTVDAELTFHKIQREFFENVFSQKTKAHDDAYEWLRKQIKEKTKFQGVYCKQMALKVAFEMIHVCYDKIMARFAAICDTIRAELGVAQERTDLPLEQALDFVVKYQFAEIWNNVRVRTVSGLVEELYAVEFELIATHEAQKVLKYDLHESAAPMKRAEAIRTYVERVAGVCWKMAVYSFRAEQARQLVLYPAAFGNERGVAFDADVHSKCTAHCKKKCDDILFFVFPVVVQRRHAQVERGTVDLAALALADADQVFHYFCNLIFQI